MQSESSLFNVTLVYARYKLFLGTIPSPEFFCKGCQKTLSKFLNLAEKMMGKSTFKCFEEWYYIFSSAPEAGMAIEACCSFTWISTICFSYCSVGNSIEHRSKQVR